MGMNVVKVADMIPFHHWPGTKTVFGKRLPGLLLHPFVEQAIVLMSVVKIGGSMLSAVLRPPAIGHIRYPGFALTAE